MRRRAFTPRREPNRCSICREPGHNKNHCPDRPVPAAEPEPPLDFAALTPDFYAAPRRVRFLCRFGVVEMIEVLENMIYWRLQGLQGQFWRGPSDSRMAAVLDIANRCRVSGRAADFRLIGRRRAA